MPLMQTRMFESCVSVRCGISLMIAAEILFAIAWAGIKAVGARLPTFEVVFFRAFLSLIILLGIMFWRKSSFRGKNYRLLILRGLLGFAGMAASFFAMIKMNLGNASILLNTFPLFVALLAPLLIGERFRHINFLFVLIAFAGIALILKPTAHIFQNVAMLGLLSGVFIAVSVIIVRKLSATDSTSVITFYFTFITTLAALPFAAFNFLWPTPFEWLLLSGIGITVTAGQLLMTKAFKYAQAASLSPFAYVSVLFAYLFGVLFWQDIPDVWSVVGGVMIIISGVAITIVEGRVRPVLPA